MPQTRRGFFGTLVAAMSAPHVVVTPLPRPVLTVDPIAEPVRDMRSFNYMRSPCVERVALERILRSER